MQSPEQLFAQRLPEYVAALENANEETRRIRFLDLVRNVFGIDLAQFQTEHGLYMGGWDAGMGRLMLNVTDNLDTVLEDTKLQLSKHITDLHHQYPAWSFKALATDGVSFMLFRPEYDAAGHVASFATEVGITIDSNDAKIHGAYLWFYTLMLNFRDRRPTTTEGIAASLGIFSSTFNTTLQELHRLFQQMEDSPALRHRVTHWRHYLALACGEDTGDTDLFLQHTYVALVARLMAAVHLGIPETPSAAELSEIVTGDYFQDRYGLTNFVEDDFFTWPLFRPFRGEPVYLEWPSGDPQLKPSSDGPGLSLVRKLLQTLRDYDFSEAPEPDVLKKLYQNLVDPFDSRDPGKYCTPDPLAERILQDELRLQENPRRSLLDPACGSGTFLVTAIRIIHAALEKEGVALDEILQHILDNVAGIDAHPLAVTVARTNYLLALGNLLRSDRGEITIPVYLADAIKLPEATGNQASSYTIQAEPELPLHIPSALAVNPEGFDYLLPRMKNKYGVRSALRAPTPEARESVMVTLYNFLVARGNWRKPFYLSQEDADVMIQTQRNLILLMEEDKGTLWYSLLRNALRPIYLSQRKFDLVVGNPPRLAFDAIHDAKQQDWAVKTLEEYASSGITTAANARMADLFFARAADLYLNEGGQIAFVMPRSTIGQEQRNADGSGMSLQKVVALEEASDLLSASACIMVAQKIG